MDIIFKSSRLRKAAQTRQTLMHEYGTRRGRVVQERLDDMKAAANLSILPLLPHLHCHELKGSLAGTLAVSLDGGFRLLFEPANDPIPRKPDGGLDWRQVTAVRITDITDYHD